VDEEPVKASRHVWSRISRAVGSVPYTVAYVAVVPTTWREVTV
jgi:hypothetical protein